MNAPAYFEIQADDLKRARDFYGAIFGWKFAKAEGLPVEYWRIETDGPRGGLLKRPAKTPPPEHGTNAFTCSMEVENFDRHNAAYRERFGFPFVICARQNKKDAILAAFPVRLRNNVGQEIDTALAEIAKIAHLRLVDAIEED